ncbi:MAG: pilus (MSHA type) biogenesis protein MshL [Pseudomonadota bacterium]|uniref:pilus (MSHA type) biogenesis protein MshL n=1 Tax=Gallaecimonas pentaromativorans TaxID=584787 RepID=UPI00067EB207|nr:pilus (MSHA type) biogenesis protein MshL [Gallaecimonas pentaromativorans]MED5527006.1 pilus (MSHA type) biogenesis protein MshL [Pseudomonadota bacterium]
MLRRLTTQSVTLLMAALLVACQSPSQRNANRGVADVKSQLPAAAKPAAPKPPAALERELLSGLVAPPPMPEQRINVSAKDTDVRDLLAGLVKGTPYSLALHPGVVGKVTLDLHNVTLADVFSVLEDLYGYDIRRQGNLVRVYPAGLRTETLAVNYLLMSRKGLSRTSITSGQLTESNRNNNGNYANNNNGFDNNNNGNGNGSLNNNSSEMTSGTRLESRSEADLWDQLEKVLNAMVGKGDGRMVAVDPLAGLVTVRAYPDELRNVKDFLTQTQDHLQRQVVLEAKIIEVTLNNDYQQGINWQRAFEDATGRNQFNLTTSGVTPSNALSAALGGVTAVTFSKGDFGAVINLLDTQGDTQVLSSPRVTATNNQKAVIKVGSDEYFVTDVQSQLTNSGTSTNTISNGIQLTPFFSGIALDVTPQISADGHVLLHVHPSVTDVSEQIKTLSLSGSTEPTVLPLAHSDIRESDTIVRAKSGDVVVIGGLMRTNNRQQVSKTPLLGDIPWLGQLFTSRRDVKEKTELVILLKPVVIEGSQDWAPQLDRSRELLDKWYPKAR